MIDHPKLLGELDKLKDFQRRTVDYVFGRMYLDASPATRFLVADEVGLGKTLVARGLIAKAITHLDAVEKVERIDVVYVCSNAAIAQQNLNRLNILDNKEHAFATRLTLLPTQLAALRGQRVNFVSFTPGTAFDMKSKGGIVQERVTLFHMLRGEVGRTDTPLRNLLRVGVRPDRWAAALEAGADDEVDAAVRRDFLRQLGASDLLRDLHNACEHFARHRDNVPPEAAAARNDVIGRLRSLLARTCVDALEPDLVIFDEFQRFKDLLDGGTEASELAHQLLAYPKVRTLLLSATPYRMVTLAHETDEDHQQDFLRTFEFLSGSRGETDALEFDLGRYRRSLLAHDEPAHAEAQSAKAAIESRLRRVMVRTERIDSTELRDAMLEERRVAAPLLARDIAQMLAVDGVSRALETGDAVEYWKSAPYLLNLMHGYLLKDKLREAAAAGADAIVEPVRQAAARLLQRQHVSSYEPLDPANPRLRTLTADTLDKGLFKLLWLPPSLPYFEATGPYADIDRDAATKSLVFSSWSVVPDAIAGLLSYDCERRMLGSAATFQYEELGEKRKPLLLFRNDPKKGPQGMPHLALLYPCVALAAHVDPLEVALHVGNGAPASLDAARAHIGAKVARLVARLIAEYGAEDGAVDQRWYWATPALLDARHDRVRAWVEARNGLRGVFDEDDEPADEDAEASTGFETHVDWLLRVLRNEERLGRPPEDLAAVMADFALASPAICALRAFRRVSDVIDYADADVMTAAARVAKGFRSLFNVPETVGMLFQGQDEEGRHSYWRSVLSYCVDGNLQAVLDEYAHVLVDDTGNIARRGGSVAREIAEQMLRALSPRSGTLSVDQIEVRDGRVVVAPYHLRCRFALRLGKVIDDSSSTVARAETVREAFNSPFRPFVLASTSIGQEGLDFHPYCHVVYHWNLPSNPVDLEQREGRVHRYKGHAVRRNISLRYGLPALRDRWSGDGDPWRCLFQLAVDDRAPGMTDLVPYWIFETDGGYRVQRRVPMLPMSREIAQLERLKKSLAVYRLVFGQARQEELLAYLAGADEAKRKAMMEARIRLGPEG